MEVSSASMIRRTSCHAFKTNLVRNVHCLCPVDGVTKRETSELGVFRGKEESDEQEERQ